MRSRNGDNPEELARGIASAMKMRRLDRNLSRAGLAARAGISEHTLRRFEQTGEVSLVRLLKIAHVLGAMDAFHSLFEEPAYESIEEVIESNRRKPRRQRGRLS